MAKQAAKRKTATKALDDETVQERPSFEKCCDDIESAVSAFNAALSQFATYHGCNSAKFGLPRGKVFIDLNMAREPAQMGYAIYEKARGQTLVNVEVQFADAPEKRWAVWTAKFADKPAIAKAGESK